MKLSVGILTLAAMLLLPLRALLSGCTPAGGGYTELPTDPPTIASFTVTPASSSVGGYSTLAWTTTNATSVAINHSVGSGLPPSGSTVVSPTTTTTYTLAATDPDSTATRTATVTVTSDPGSPPPASEMPENFAVAFIGDQGSGTNARAVLQLIKKQGANMVLHPGDFDYSSNPTAWDKLITDVLGAGFPYFTSVGNHDTRAWSGPNGYQAKLQARLSRIPDARCSGDLGVKSACTYKGLFFILSGVGTQGSGHEAYMADQLARTNAIWRICSWHKDQHLMQVGDKDDEVGWGAYETCRQGGAIIATAHEHSYARTHLMDDIQHQHVVSTANTLQIEKGKTFVFHSGLGGKSIRDQKLSGPWWAAIYTVNQGANYGALFCTFNLNGVANRASCYFMDIAGNIPDRFEVISAVQ